MNSSLSTIYSIVFFICAISMTICLYPRADELHAVAVAKLEKSLPPSSGWYYSFMYMNINEKICIQTRELPGYINSVTNRNQLQSWYGGRA